jgi:transglutaminase-like putative cysteine protease
MAVVHGRIADGPGGGALAATAEDVIVRGTGDRSDRAHVFIAAARQLGFPARYVSGYMMDEHAAGEATGCAWAEAYVEALGWVGFDATDNISPEDNYVRVAIGRDHRDAAAISGIPSGHGAEWLVVHLTVEQ